MAVDEGGPVGAHAGDDGFGVEGVGVAGVALESGVGETVGLGGSVLEALLDDGIDGGTLARGEAGVVGKELDVEDAEAVELSEDVGGCVGGGAEGIFGVGGDPLLEVGVGGSEVEIVEGVVAVVEWRACEGGAEGECG